MTVRDPPSWSVDPQDSPHPHDASSSLSPIWLSGWLGLLAIAIANGTIRALVIQPLWGEEVARRFATAVLLGAIAIYVWWFEGRHPLRLAGEAWGVGLAWAVLTLTFEFGLGLATGLSWAEMLADYDLAHGRIWVIVPVFIAFAPSLARKARLDLVERTAKRRG